LTADLMRVVSARWVAEASGALTYEDAALREGRNEVTGRLRGGVSNAAGRLIVNPSLGLELFRGPGGHRAAALPALSVRVGLKEGVPGRNRGTSVPLAGAFLRAGAARIVRAPTFNDRYWLPGGNPDLNPERGWSADAGLGLSLSGAGLFVETEATLFGSLLHDKIVWQPALTGPSVQTWSPGNVGRVIGRGLEWSGSVTARPRLPFTVRIRTAYTYARMEDRTTRRAASWARQLRYVPEHVLKIHLALDAGWTGLDVLLNMTGRRYITSDESQWLRPNHDLSVRLRAGFPIPGGRIRASVALENALDADLQSIRFYPLPPRHLGFALVFERGP
jgi:iron complex outermembrane receptor protein